MPPKLTAKKKTSSPPPAPPPAPPKPKTIEERTALLEARLQNADLQMQADYRDSLDLSWIAHDSALEGAVYTPLELRAAIDSAPIVQDEAITQPIVDEIRRHREALNFVRDYATKKKQPITLDTLKQIYLILHPEEGDLKTVKFRKDIPQHRLYFHEYAAPDKIAPRMRQIMEWVADPETSRTRTPVRLASRAHYDILRVFPFTHDSGTVARLFMNLILLRGGYPPAIIHSTERQRYYDALKGASATMSAIVQDAIDNSLASIEKLLDHYEARAKGASLR